jgi:hypothetical protein
MNDHRGGAFLRGPQRQRGSKAGPGARDHERLAVKSSLHRSRSPK